MPGHRENTKDHSIRRVNDSTHRMKYQSQHCDRVGYKSNYRNQNQYQSHHRYDRNREYSSSSHSSYQKRLEDYNRFSSRASSSMNSSYSSYSSCSSSPNSSFSSTSSESSFCIERKTRNRNISAIKECVVFDTNALIDYPAIIAHTTKNKMLSVVPYIVVEEMNKLKYRKPYLAADLAKVGHQIEGLASNKNAYLELESAAEKLQDFVDFREQQNDLDDSILKCALRVKTELRGELNVTLVTSDTNLLVKAHCNNLNALSTAKFLHKSGYWSQNRYEPHHSRRKRNSQQRRG